MLKTITYKAARVNRGFTLKEASVILGIRPATLLNYEKGYTNPKSETLRKMANLYGCEVTDFKEVSGE